MIISKESTPNNSNLSGTKIHDEILLSGFDQKENMIEIKSPYSLNPADIPPPLPNTYQPHVPISSY